MQYEILVTVDNITHLYNICKNLEDAEENKKEAEKFFPKNYKFKIKKVSKERRTKI